MKKTVFVILLCGIFVFGSVCVAAAKVGFINVQKIVSESKIGKNAKLNVDKLREEKQKDVKKSLEDINKLKEEIEKKQSKWSAAERQKKADELQQKIKDHKRLVADVNEEIKKKDRDLVALILKKADEVVKKVAKKGKYTLIIKDPNAVGYLDPGVDITDNVVKELNKK